jgi:hypothetical protein
MLSIKIVYDLWASRKHCKKANFCHQVAEFVPACCVLDQAWSCREEIDGVGVMSLSETICSSPQVLSVEIFEVIDTEYNPNMDMRADHAAVWSF